MKIRAAAPLAVALSFLALAASAHAGTATVAAGEAQSCGILAGALTCWGGDSTIGALGTGVYRTDDTPDPQPVAGAGAGVTDVDLTYTGGGSGTTGCAVVNGGVLCWGQNNEGQFGNGTSGGSSATPVPATGLESGVTHVSVATNHVCAVQNGAARCWGNGGYGKLGDDTDDDRLTAVTPIGLGSGVTDIATGAAHTCAIQSGVVMCFGRNHLNALGRDVTNGNEDIPVAMEGQPGPAVEVAASGSSNCMVNTSGAAYCFGSNSDGLLGSGSTESSSQAAQAVSGLGSGVTDLAGEFKHTCAIKDGGGFCWGHGTGGELGNGASITSNVPVAVQGLTGVTSMAVGNGHSCAAASGGRFCWGSNQHFELGAATPGESAVPIRVSDPVAVPDPDPAVCAKAEAKLRKAEKKLKKLKKKENVSRQALKKAKKAVKDAKAAVKEAC